MKTNLSVACRYASFKGRLFAVFCLLLCVVFCRGDIVIRAENKLYIITEQQKYVFADSKHNFAGNKTIWERAKLLKSEKDIDTLLPEVKLMVNKIQRQIEYEAFEGNVRFNANSTNARDDFRKMFSVGPQANGKMLDKQKLYTDIYDALTSDKKEVHAQIIETKPKRTPKQVIDGIGQRSKFSTSFVDSKPERISNIVLSLSKFNGKIIPPHATMSFNEITGKRSLNAGYKEANIILDGDFVPAVGGGVCQTSTTLYNACLRAGLEVTESHQHSLPVNYIPLGLDAMVNGDMRDLKIKNNTNGNIYIRTYIENNKACVEIYGDKLGSTSYKPRTEKDKENPLRVTSYLDTYKNGARTDTRKLRRSTYKLKEEPSQKPGIDTAPIVV